MVTDPTVGDGVRNNTRTEMVANGMVQSKPRNRLPIQAIVYSFGFALLWAVLAVIRPSTTFHLAPLLVALAVPVVYRIQGGRNRSTGVRLAAGGVAIAALATALLAAGGLLEGPSLLPVGGALGESLVGVGVGGMLGLVVGGWPLPAETT